MDVCGLSLINAKVFRGVMQNNLSLVNCQRRKETEETILLLSRFSETKKGQNYACWGVVLDALISSRGQFFPSKALLIVSHTEIMNLLESSIVSKCHFHLR